MEVMFSNVWWGTSGGVPPRIWKVSLITHMLADRRQVHYYKQLFIKLIVINTEDFRLSLSQNCTKKC